MQNQIRLSLCKRYTCREPLRHFIKADVNRIKYAKLTFSLKCRLSSLFKTSSLKPVIIGHLCKGKLFIWIRILDNLHTEASGFFLTDVSFVARPRVWLSTCEGEAVTRLTPALSFVLSFFSTRSPLIFFRLQTTVSLYASCPHMPVTVTWCISVNRFAPPLLSFLTWG